MRFLDFDDVVAIHDAILHATGGHPGLWMPSALDSALGRARHGPFGAEPDQSHRAALLLRGICQDHPFVDGNKRTAYEAADVFLAMNGWGLAASPSEITAFMLDVAQAQRSISGIESWLEEHTILKKGH